MMKSQKISI